MVSRETLRFVIPGSIYRNFFGQSTRPLTPRAISVIRESMKNRKVGSVIALVVGIILLVWGIVQRQNAFEMRANSEHGVSIGPIQIGAVDTQQRAEADQTNTWSIILLVAGAVLVVIGGVGLFSPNRK